MPWVKLDDAFFDNIKIIEAGRDARDLYIAGLCFCARRLTDGFIPEGQVPRLAADAGVENAPCLATKLLTVGLWESTEGGYEVHDYLEYNPSRDEALALRQVRSEAGRVGGQHSGESKREAKAKASAIATPEANEEQNTYPVPVPVPVPLTPDPDPGNSAPLAPVVLDPEPPCFAEETVPFQLASRLRGRILENNPKARVPAATPKALFKWSAAFDLLLRRDCREPAEVEAVVDWCQADHFWRKNILSGPTFRDQYDRLYLGWKDAPRTAGRARASPGNGKVITPIREQTDEDLAAREELAQDWQAATGLPRTPREWQEYHEARKRGETWQPNPRTPA